MIQFEVKLDSIFLQFQDIIDLLNLYGNMKFLSLRKIFGSLALILYLRGNACFVK